MSDYDGLGPYDVGESARDDRDKDTLGQRLDAIRAAALTTDVDVDLVVEDGARAGLDKCPTPPRPERRHDKPLASNAPSHRSIDEHGPVHCRLLQIAR
ncbi:hypothetical protein [Streptomyces sp. NPDC001774]